MLTLFIIVWRILNRCDVRMAAFGRQRSFRMLLKPVDQTSENNLTRPVGTTGRVRLTDGLFDCEVNRFAPVLAIGDMVAIGKLQTQGVSA